MPKPCRHAPLQPFKGGLELRLSLSCSRVQSVDEELRMLVAGNLAASVDRLELGSVDRGGSLSASGFMALPIAGTKCWLRPMVISLLRVTHVSADQLKNVTQARTKFNTGGSSISKGRRNDVEERRTGAGSSKDSEL